MGVYSPVSRCGKSALALTLAQALGRNFSVLYMNLEEYSGFSRLVDGGYEGFIGCALSVPPGGV